MIRRAALLLLLPTAATAHSGTQSFVALLPTELYIAGGLVAVVLTVALLTLLPEAAARRLFTPRRFRNALPPTFGQGVTTAFALGLFIALLWTGRDGSNDPTRNPLTVAMWTVLWLHLLVFAGLVGNPWPWLNPWTFALRLAPRPRLALPSRLGHGPAVVSLAALAALLLIHPRAADPDTLATLALLYWAAHLILAVLFGPVWLARGEAITVLFAAFAALAPVSFRGAGMPGWQALARPAPDLGLTLFFIALLALGSFDGLSKTYLWLDLIGVNPLAFEGRTTVIGPNSLGLGLALPLLAAAYAACLIAGLALIGQAGRAAIAFRAFAPTLLPIAFAYHFAHFLPALLVESQRIPVVLNDPFGTGAALLGLADPAITTGFLNRLDTVRTIWLTQAGAVVLGHMLAIAMAHRVALDIAGNHRRAVLSQLPLALLMIGYSLFGLWLLASPRGA